MCFIDREKVIEDEVPKDMRDLVAKKRFELVGKCCNLLFN